MVQREVADRFFAAPGTKSYGAVSVLVQLTAERTGFHPVARTCFRPPPNVDSALVAFRRTRNWGPEFAHLKEVVQSAFAHRRKTLAQLARALPRRQGGGRVGAGEARATAGHPSRGARPRSSSSSWRSSCREAAPRRREDQSRARRRARPRGRAARGRHRHAADRHLRRGRARAGTESRGRRLPKGHDRPRRARAARRRGRASSRTGAPRSGSGFRWPPASAEGAPTPPRRSSSPTRCSTSRFQPSGLQSSPPASGPTFPSSSSPGPKLAEGAGERLTALELPQDFWVVVALPRRASKTLYRRRLRPLRRDRTATAGFEERRAALLEALAAVRRPRDFAAFPPNDLAEAAGRPTTRRRAPAAAAPSGQT